MAENVDAEFAEESLCEGADGNTRRRFAGGSALEDIASLGKVVLQSAGQVGMTRAGRSYPLVPGRVALAYGQGLLPVLPVSVFKLDRDGRANCHAVSDAGEDVSRITLNLHAAAAAIALLPPPEFTVEICLVDFQPCGQAREESDQSFAVGFSGGEVAQHKCSILPDAASLWSSRTEKEAHFPHGVARKGTPPADFHRRSGGNGCYNGERSYSCVV